MSRDDYVVHPDLGDGVVRDKYDVSIIIPAYVDGSEKLEWLEECLHSAVQNEAFVVVLDDNSPVDLSRLRSDFGIHVDWYKSGRNIGVSAARNVAVSKANTKFIFPLDGDDSLAVGSIARLLDNWKGVPVYPDVLKYNNETKKSSHYMLKNFDCDIITKHVAVASVGVLHTKEQWETVGGWNETLNLFEDGEYNARLMMYYCGVHYAEPLYHYRIHPEQKTNKYNKAEYDKIKYSVLGMIRSNTMAKCPSCRGKRRGNPMLKNKDVQGSVPGETEEMVLAQYIGGKGRGWHYHKGSVTKYPYKVTYGQHIHVNPQDADPHDARVKTKLFVMLPVEATVAPTPEILIVDVPPTKPAPSPPLPPEPVLSPQAELQQELDIPVVAVEGEDDEEYDEVDELPDISNMTVGELMEWEYDMETVAELMEIERRGKNRKGALAYLRSLIDENRPK